jgi:hypothetical protein
MYNLNNFFVDYRSKGIKLLKNIRFTNSEVSVRTHYDRQKKPRSTEKVTEENYANKDGDRQK